MKDKFFDRYGRKRIRMRVRNKPMVAEQFWTKKPARFQIIESFSQEQVKQVHRLYQQEWWTQERTYPETLAVIEQSQLCISVVDNDHNVIGFSRVLTDFVFKAFVFDVIVQEDWRGQKVGRLILDTLVNHSRIKNVQHLELYCLPQLEPFYEPFGFSTNAAGTRLMRRISETRLTDNQETAK